MLFVISVTRSGSSRTLTSHHEQAQDAIRPEFRPVEINEARESDPTEPFRILQDAKDQVAQLSSAIADAEQLIASARQHAAAPVGRRVRRLIAMRRRRDAAFPAGLFADAAWDILLELLASELEGRTVTISDACNAAAVPMTTALRSIQNLVDKQVIERATDMNDRRRSLLRLAHNTRIAMLHILQTD